MDIARHFKYYVIISFERNSASLKSLKSFLLQFLVPERGSTLSFWGEKGHSWTQNADICQKMDEVCHDKV